MSWCSAEGLGHEGARVLSKGEQGTHFPVGRPGLFPSSSLRTHDPVTLTLRAAVWKQSPLR